MTYNKYLNIIWNDLIIGRKYGEYLTNVRYPMFWTNLYMRDNYIVWRHYGESANKATMRDLEWIITEIFKQTPEQFYKTHIVEN